MSGARIFRLAPMCRVMRALTIVVLAIPPVVSAAIASSPAAFLAPWLFAGLVLLYLGVWLAARPTHFEVASEGLTIQWPLRSEHIPWARIREAREIAASELRGEVGIGARVGVGGLWGAFGWLFTSRRGWLDLYVSRGDGMVWIEGRERRSLLLTPEDPAAFSRAVREHTRGA